MELKDKLIKLIFSEYEEKKNVNKNINKALNKIIKHEKKFLSTLSTEQKENYFKLSSVVDEYQLESIIDYIDFTITFIIDFYNFLKN